MFFINGALFANWVLRIPEIQAKLALSEGSLLRDGSNAVPEPDDSIFRLRPRALWPLGAVAFCSAIAPSPMADWSGIYELI